MCLSVNQVDTLWHIASTWLTLAIRGGFVGSFVMKLGLNGGKQTQIGMRQKFSGAEAVHEILIDIQLQVGDSLADLMDLVMVCIGLKGQGGASQRAVPQ